MRILLCDNVLIDHARPDAPFDLQPHLGLLSLLAVALNHGHDGSIFDPSLALHRGRLTLDDSFYRDLAWALLDEQPDVLGFTTLGCNLICTYKVADHVKKQRPGLPIVIGGPHATILHREILSEFDVFDVIVRNEAETNLPALLDGIRAGDLSEIPGLTFRLGEQLISGPPIPLLDDLDDLPWPAYERYPIEELELSSMRVEAGRGCPFNCTFCSTASFFGRRYRLKSSKRLVSELDFLYGSYGISDFALTHDMFTANKNKVRDFCEVVADRGYTWSCSARMDCVDSELLTTMYEAGCRSIYYGVETGSPRMQKISRKHLDLDLVEPILDLTIALGMKAVVSMITGYPEEEVDDQDATLDMLGDCFHRGRGLVNVQLHLLTPEPGTALYEQYGEQLAYDGHITDFNFPTLEDDDGAMLSAHPALFMNHHYYPTTLPRKQHVFVEQVVQLLLGLGLVLLHRILQNFDGRLSLLIREMQQFAGGPDACMPDDALLLDFVEHTWGSSHAMHSAVRFLITGRTLRARVHREPARSNADDDVWRLGSSTALLKELHDIPAMLAALPTDPMAVERACEDPPRNFLLLVAPEWPDWVRAFAVHGIAVDLLEWLSAPKTSGELLTWLEDNDDSRGTLRSFIENLRGLGVLIAPAGLGAEPASVSSPR